MHRIQDTCFALISLILEVKGRRKESRRWMGSENQNLVLKAKYIITMDYMEYFVLLSSSTKMDAKNTLEQKQPTPLETYLAEDREWLSLSRRYLAGK